jgi:hypothetical protein
MVVLMEDIMLEIELHKRFYNHIFIGLPFLKVLMGPLDLKGYGRPRSSRISSFKWSY